MFEHSLIELDKRQPRRRWLSLPIAVGFHLALVAAVTLAQAWNVAEVPEPTENVVFFTLAPPPPPPAAPAGPSGQPDKPVKPEPATKPNQPVQPDVVPDVEPEAVTPTIADLAPPVSDESGLTRGGDTKGVPGGDPEGIEHGDPRGSGHDFHGIPGGVEPKNDIIHVTGAVKRPEFLSGPQPRYTEAARHAGTQGVVILDAVIDQQGRVTDLQLRKGLPMGLDKSALEAVSAWRFKPATLGGRAVSVYYTLTVTFQLQR